MRQILSHACTASSKFFQVKAKNRRESKLKITEGNRGKKETTPTAEKSVNKEETEEKKKQMKEIWQKENGTPNPVTPMENANEQRRQKQKGNPVGLARFTIKKGT